MKVIDNQLIDSVVGQARKSPHLRMSNKVNDGLNMVRLF